jgi:hypothetical protein
LNVWLIGDCRKEKRVKGETLKINGRRAPENQGPAGPPGGEIPERGRGRRARGNDDDAKTRGGH